jgi:hypothetical protein
MNNNDIVVDPVETSAATNNRDIIFDPVETSSATNNEDIGDPVETSAATNNEEIGSLVETRAAANDPVETSSATNNEDFGVSVETSATMSNDDIVVDPVETSSAMSSEDLSDAVETSTATNENVVDPVNTSSAMKNDDVDTVENSSANDIDDTVPFSCSEDNDGSFNMATVCKQLSPTLKLPYGNNIDGQSRGTTSTVKLILSRTSNIKSEILKYQQCDKGNRPVRTQSFVAVSAAELIKCDRGVHLKNTEDLGDALSCLQSSGKGNPNMAQSVRPVSTILINKRHEHGKNCSFDIPVSAVDGCSGLPKTDCQSGIISNDKDHSKPSLNTYKPLRTVTTVKKGFPGKQHVTTSVRPPLGDPQMAQPVRAMSVPLSAIDGRIGLPKADWPSGICSDKEHNKPSVNTDQSMRTVTTVKKGLPRKQHETTSVKNGTSGTSCSLDICVQNFDVINASHSRTELSKKDQLSSISCYQKFLSNCNKYVENITDDDEIADDEEHSLENSEDDYVPDSSEDSVTSDNSKSSGDGMCIKGRNMVAKQRKRGYQMQKPQLGSDFSKKPKNNNDTDDDDASSESNESSEDDSYVTRRKLVSKAKRAHEKQKSVFDADSENRRKLKHTEPDSTVNNEDENQQRVHSTVAAASNCKNKRKWDKEYVCVYCSCHVKGKLPRHLERHHVAEFDVAKALSYPKKSKERKRLLKIISNKGNFHHNMAVYKQRSGTLIPNRRPSARVAAGDISDYIPCSTCYGTYSRHLMWKHKKECVAMRESNENSCLQTQGRGHVRVQARCAALIPVADGISKDFERKILNTMIPDDISLVVRNDKLITHYGVKLFDTYGHQNDRHQYISQKLRELARLLIDLMKHNKNIHGLWGCLKPQKFPIVVNSVRNIAGFDSSSKTYAKPSLALRLGHSLKACANEIESQAMIDGLDLDKQQAADFVRLCDAQWSSKVSTHALSTLHERKWNKPLLLPLTEDIKKLHTHLDNEANRCRSEPISKAVWYQLAQVLLAQIILFNRRRSGEVGRMKLSEYVKATESKIDMHDDVRSSLSALEKSLCDKFTRLEIRGKRGRKVPVLLASEMKDNVDYLISKRNEIGVAESNEYVFAVPTHQSDRHIRGSDCVRKFSVDCGASIPANLTSTKLRKHVATVSQILNLKKNELDVLAGFMGHDILVHRNYYRLPENTVEVAKVSRILLAMERGEISKYQGKSLEEITLDEHEATEGEHSDVDEEIQDDTEEGQISMLNNEECSDVEPDSDCQVEKQQKRS